MHENVPKQTQPVFIPNTPGVVINNSNVVNNGTGVVGQPTKSRVRVIYRDRPVSINFNFNGDTTKKAEVALPPPSVNDNSGNILPFYDWSNRLILAACIFAILLVTLFLMMDWYRRRHPATLESSGTSSVTHSHTHSHKHEFASLPKAESTAKPDPFKGMEEARADAKATGAIFRVYDNGYKVEFPKPPVAPAEKKQQ